MVCIALGHASFGHFVLIFYASDLFVHDIGAEHINLTQKHFDFGLNASGYGMAEQKQMVTDFVERRIHSDNF